jgi:hypothetical protein
VNPGDANLPIGEFEQANQQSANQEIGVPREAFLLTGVIVRDSQVELSLLGVESTCAGIEACSGIAVPLLSSCHPGMLASTSKDVITV